MNSLITSPYREQHNDILEISSVILDCLDIDKLKGNSHIVRRSLSKLAGLVQIHLVLEDNSLYPILANSDNEVLKETSVKFMAEMGDISKVFTEYLDKWSTSSSIRNNTDQFITETKNILDSLNSRIMRENDIFYKQIDELL